jgi:hypothetical protein
MDETRTSTVLYARGVAKGTAKPRRGASDFVTRDIKRPPTTLHD